MFQILSLKLPVCSAQLLIITKKSTSPNVFWYPLEWITILKHFFFGLVNSRVKNMEMYKDWLWKIIPASSDQLVFIFSVTILFPGGKLFIIISSLHMGPTCTSQQMTCIYTYISEKRLFRTKAWVCLEEITSYHYY